jgi:hypothetical protein
MCVKEKERYPATKDLQELHESFACFVFHCFRFHAWCHLNLQANPIFGVKKNWNPFAETLKCRGNSQMTGAAIAIIGIS